MSSPTFIAPYARDTARYDELLTSSGDIRGHWRALIDRLESAGPESVRRGVELARRLIIENGVTYNVYADANGMQRLWQLDPVPLALAGCPRKPATRRPLCDPHQGPPRWRPA